MIRPLCSLESLPAEAGAPGGGELGGQAPLLVPRVRDWSAHVRTPPNRPALRVAELVATLSLGTDLGLGQPMEHMIRACLIALRLGDSLGLNGAERETVYYSGLLAWVGCHTDAYEQAKWFGDDALLKSDAHYRYDMGKVGPSVAFMLKYVGGPRRPLATRARVGVGLLGDGRKALMALAGNHYRATDELAARLGLGDEIRESLRQSYERWDGKGAYGMKREEIALASRLVNLADVVEVYSGRLAKSSRIGGDELADLGQDALLPRRPYSSCLMYLM